MQKINTALLSFGMSGQIFHAPFIAAHPGFSLYGVWERSKNGAAEKYPGIKTFRTLDDLLADEAIQLVVVNTPNATHYDYATKALQAGRHVIVEKPFVVHTDQGEALIALAKKQNRLLSVYHNRRFDSDYKIVKQVVNENWLGNIVEAEFHYDRYKEELSPKLHKEISGPGTGALYDLGSHLIDQALQLFGWPQAVFADIRKVRPVSAVDDYFELLLYYDALRVRLHCSYLVREAVPAYALHGSKGSFIKNKSDVQEMALQKGEKPGNEDWGKEPEEERGLLHAEVNGSIVRERIAAPAGNYGEYYESIYQSLTNGAPLPVSAKQGLDVIRIIEAAFASAETGYILSLRF